MKNTYIQFEKLFSKKTLKLIKKFKKDLESNSLRNDFFNQYTKDYPEVKRLDRDIMLISDNKTDIVFAYSERLREKAAAIRYIQNIKINETTTLNVSFGFNFTLDLYFSAFEVKENGLMIMNVRHTQQINNEIELQEKYIKSGVKNYYLTDFEIFTNLDFSKIFLNNYFNINELKEIMELTLDINIKNSVLISKIHDFNTSQDNIKKNIYEKTL